MLRWRFAVAAAIIAALIGLCWLDARSAQPGLWLLPAAVFFTVGATAEMLALARQCGMDPRPGIVHAANLALVLAPWAGAVCHGGQCPMKKALAAAGAAPATLLALAVLLVFLGEMGRYRKPGGVLANIAAAVFAIVYVGAMLSCAVQLRLNFGLAALASWIIVVKLGDIGAYSVGRLVGRHKFAPVLSPSKTWEGAAGALLFSALGAWAVFHIGVTVGADARAHFHFLPPHSPSWGWLPFGLLMGGVGMIGDLAESLLKRDAGSKDSSRWLPGLGGLLNILDSLLLTVPLAWFCWSAGLVG